MERKMKAMNQRKGEKLKQKGDSTIKKDFKEDVWLFQNRDKWLGDTMYGT